MLQSVFGFLINVLSKSFGWLFTIYISDSPRFSLGTFILSCATIGLVLHFILGTDFFMNFTGNRFGGSRSSDNYQPRHVIGSRKVMPTTRVGRNYNKD